MKLNKLFFIAVTVIALSSCSNNAGDNDITTESKSLDISKGKANIEGREPGQIPSNINFIGKINEVTGNPAAYMSLLRDYKSQYGNTDFYNNLFEVTSYDLFKDEKFSQLSADDYKFLIGEMRTVQSNMANMENLPTLMHAALKAGAITNEEFDAISNELLVKNQKEIKSIPDKNKILRSEKLKEAEDIESALNYRRARY
jgi:hypothetical protein